MTSLSPGTPHTYLSCSEGECNKPGLLVELWLAAEKVVRTAEDMRVVKVGKTAAVMRAVEQAELDGVRDEPEGWPRQGPGLGRRGRYRAGQPMEGRPQGGKLEVYCKGCGGKILTRMPFKLKPLPLLVEDLDVCQLCGRELETPTVNDLTITMTGGWSRDKR